MTNFRRFPEVSYNVTFLAWPQYSHSTVKKHLSVHRWLPRYPCRVALHNLFVLKQDMKVKGVSFYEQLKSSFQRSMIRLFSNLKFSKINKSERFSSGPHDVFFNYQRVILKVYDWYLKFQLLLRFYQIVSTASTVSGYCQKEVYLGIRKSPFSSISGRSRQAVSIGCNEWLLVGSICYKQQYFGLDCHWTSKQ